MPRRWNCPLRYIASVALLLGAVASHAECSRTLRFVASEYPPYVFKAETLSGRGIDLDILLATATEAGCRVDVLTDIPNRRIQAMFEAGAVDVFTGYSLTEKRQEFARFSRPYRTEVIGIFSLRRDSPPDAIKTFSDVLERRYHLIAPAAGYYGAAYADAAPLLSDQGLLTKVDGPERAVRMLSMNRGDLMLYDADVAQYTARLLGLGPLQKMVLEPSNDKVYLALSKASTTENDLKVLDKALERLLANGTIDKITRRYIEKAK